MILHVVKSVKKTHPFNEENLHSLYKRLGRLSSLKYHAKQPPLVCLLEY